MDDVTMMSPDEDAESENLRHKRRSWKQHRLQQQQQDDNVTIRGLGDNSYVCDQCDKSFSKQSSLARHKYEHSGKQHSIFYSV